MWGRQVLSHLPYLCRAAVSPRGVAFVHATQGTEGGGLLATRTGDPARLQAEPPTGRPHPGR